MINEGIEMGDLARLVDPLISIDEFRSKMGEDKDIIVIGFSVMGKGPADDIVNFVEKSYDWVLDADISSGETSDGNYMVFVELQRKQNAPGFLVAMITDLLNLTDQKIEDWSFTYYKHDEKLPLTKENLTKKMLLTPEDYEARTDAHLGESARLNSLRALAGVYVNPTKISDMQILGIQRAAGIK